MNYRYTFYSLIANVMQSSASLKQELDGALFLRPKG